VLTQTAHIESNSFDPFGGCLPECDPLTLAECRARLFC